MADLRVPATRLPVTPAQNGAGPNGTGKAEAVKAAQRAFFDAALAKAPASAAASVKPVAAAVPSVQSAAPAVAASPSLHATRAAVAPQPGRLLRPGSLLDVKV